MVKALQTGGSLAAATLLYSLLISGVGPYRLDWSRALFIGVLGFLVHCLYLLVKSKRSHHAA